LPESGIDGAACVGRTPDSLPALAESANATLLAQVRLATNQGGVCAARVFVVTDPVRLYRVFDSAHPHSKFGGWWSLTPPEGSREAYRATFAICPEWSPLDRVVSCEVRPGSVVVVGTTQSAICQDGKVLPKSASLQVFVANDGRAGIVHVGACSEERPWP
jgi:hypothetical protein